MSNPKIYVFCNTRCNNEGDWHEMIALAEDGAVLASHICSHHAFASLDMGIDEDGRKRDLYAAHYPQGFDVEWVEDPEKHPWARVAMERARAAYASAQSAAKADAS